MKTTAEKAEAMIQFRHHTDRTVRIPVDSLSERWDWIAYSDYGIRFVDGVIEIKQEDEIEWAEEEDEVNGTLRSDAHPSPTGVLRLS